MKPRHSTNFLSHHTASRPIIIVQSIRNWFPKHGTRNVEHQTSRTQIYIVHYMPSRALSHRAFTGKDFCFEMVTLRRFQRFQPAHSLSLHSSHVRNFANFSRIRFLSPIFSQRRALVGHISIIRTARICVPWTQQTAIAVLILISNDSSYRPSITVGRIFMHQRVPDWTENDGERNVIRSRPHERIDSV